MVDEVDAGALHVEVVEAVGHHLVDEVGDGAGRLDAGRSGPDDDDVEGALVDVGRVAVGGLEHLEQPGPQRLGVVDRVEREGVLLGARGVEEVGPRPGGEHEVVPGERLAVRRRDGAGGRVDRGHRQLLDGDRLVLVEDGAERAGDVGGRQLGRGHLVQQRLELVVVVAVEQRDGHAVLAELLGAADAGEAAADDHDRGGVVSVLIVLVPSWSPWVADREGERAV